VNDLPVHIQVFVEPMFGENALLVTASGRDGLVGWVVDPSFHPHADRLVEYARQNEITVERILLTHGHADHIAGTDIVHAAFPQAIVMISAADEPMLRDAELNLSAPFGLGITLSAPVGQYLEPGIELRLGDVPWFVLDSSGHSPGGRSLYCPPTVAGTTAIGGSGAMGDSRTHSSNAGILITGDALFAGSIGRTDFPGSSHERLIANIRANLLSLPGSTIVYCGHGLTTTIENERKSNPYLAE